MKQLNKEWYRNADELAAFLRGANLYLKNEDLKNSLYMHNDLSASLAKDWNARIVAIDEGITHIILMADTITAGVIKQFEERYFSLFFRIIKYLSLMGRGIFLFS